jgi:CCR4-NOT transcription complex subunit 1
LLQVLLRCCNTSNNSDSAPNASPPEVNLISKIVSVVNKVLSHNHDHTLNRIEPTKDAALLQQQLMADGNRPKLPEEQAYQVLLMQRPYVRFLSNLMTSNFRSSDQSHQQQIIADETLRVILDTLNQLNPQIRPAFAFGWLELVCHRLLLPRVMRTPGKDAYPLIAQNPRRHWIRYANLLVAGLKFLDPFTKNPEGIPTPVLVFFRSFLKLMLVILHDFPEYILHTNYLLCDHIPSCCIQLRNVVLCAFPNTIRLPDPFKYNTAQANTDNDNPPECPDYVADNLKDIASSDDIQRLILSANRQEVGRLVEKLVEISPLGGRKWNISAINSLVVMVAVKQLMLTSQEPRMTSHNPAFRIYYAMAEAMDNEGRYYLINAFVNQLRFPNSHTRFFSALVLAFFLPVDEASPRTLDVVQEQVLRVIVERLVAPRPHPWGLLVTFVDLFRDDKYKVWTKACIRCSPDVERTITQLAKTISNDPPR